MSYLWKENIIDIPIKKYLSQSQSVFWPWVCFFVFFFCLFFTFFVWRRSSCCQYWSLLCPLHIPWQPLSTVANVSCTLQNGGNLRDIYGCRISVKLGNWVEKRNQEYVPANGREDCELLLCREVILERGVGQQWRKASVRLEFSRTLNLQCNPLEIQAVGVCAYIEVVGFT